jgi:hypothetical protein
MLHLRSGDDILKKLEEAGLPGEFVKWADPLCQGPAPAGLSATEWRAVRAKFAVENFGVNPEAARLFLLEQDRNLEKFREHADVVLWFEHDLFCQIILIYLLNWFSERPLGKTKLFLICIGAYSGIDDFRGLGDLTSGQLAMLFDARHKVSDKEMVLARRAWKAFSHSDPRMVERLLRQDTSALPFLSSALLRHLQEFPSTWNGLNRTEQFTLEVIAQGVVLPEQIFRHVQKREIAPWCTDTMFWSCLRRLATVQVPALTIESLAPTAEFLPGQSRIRLSEKGRELLAGESDWIKLNGIERWIGGVELSGREAAWRWDEMQRELVAYPFP